MAENDQTPEQAAGNSEDAASQPRFNIQRLYVKDVSFEVPDSPECFKKQFNPKVDFSINTRSSKLEDNLFEVVLRLTADVKQDDKTTYLAEIQQAGIFEVSGVDDEQLVQVLNITCPNVLFPYGREVLDSVITKGSFPALMLAPVNFEAIFNQARQQTLEKEAAAAASAEVQ